MCCSAEACHKVIYCHIRCDTVMDAPHECTPTSSQDTQAHKGSRGDACQWLADVPHDPSTAPSTNRNLSQPCHVSRVPQDQPPPFAHCDSASWVSVLMWQHIPSVFFDSTTILRHKLKSTFRASHLVQQPVSCSQAAQLAQAGGGTQPRLNRLWPHPATHTQQHGTR